MRGIVRDQRINRIKMSRAREFRLEMTESECTVWAHLRKNQLAGLHFRRQQIIDGFIVDFYCHAASIVVEVDGGVHERTIEQDRQRDQLMKEKGLLVLRIKNEEIDADIDQVLGYIAQICRERLEKA